jgi:drug/metabolite transporter (DMT)-like permease
LFGCVRIQMRYRAPSRMPRFVVPAAFVVLWSTGFLGARLGLPYCEPLHLLGLRFGIVAVLLLFAAVVWRAPWPPRPNLGWIALVGLLLHGVCLGGYFTAMNTALPLGLVALIGSLQPVLTAIASRLVFGERLRPMQWLGIALGVAGVALVASGKFGGGRVQTYGLVACFIGVLGITAGTLVQKRTGGSTDFRTMGVIQYAVAAVAVGLVSFAWESRPVVWTGQFIFALAWLVIVNSIVSIALLFVMVRRSSVSQVSSLFYLTPSVTAVFAFLLFREPLNPLMIAGILISGLGVYLTVSRGAPAAAIEATPEM